MSRKHRSRRPFLSPLREEEQLAPADPSRRTKRMAAAAAFVRPLTCCACACHAL